jgi:hypothetical protein
MHTLISFTEHFGLFLAFWACDRSELCRKHAHPKIDTYTGKDGDHTHDKKEGHPIGPEETQIHQTNPYKYEQQGKGTDFIEFASEQHIRTSSAVE